MSAAELHAPPAPSPTRWRDPKRYAWLLGVVTMTLPLDALNWYRRSGSPLALWFGPMFVFIAIPLFDALFGEDRSNPPDSAVPTLEADNYYRVVLWLAVPVQIIGFFVAVHVAMTRSLPWHGLLGLAITTGTTMGISINTAHELGHKYRRVEQWLAKVALTPVAYGHFTVEHNLGHHARVATPEDPASARYGESFWRFLPRTVFGSLRSAWRIESRRLEKQGRPLWHPSNEVLQAFCWTSTLWITLAAVYGPRVLLFLTVQAVFGFSLLEVVNYVEHYGLCREKRADGKYERCQPEHSWNSNHVVTNLFLYQLQRHSDHHAHPQRAYQSLRHFPDAPQLPSGYATMILLAWFPPLWFAVMNPRVSAHYGGDLSRTNRG